MCRGLALGYDVETNKFICNGASSHTDLLGEREDQCIKLEIIIDDLSETGYFIELDSQYLKKGKVEELIYEKFQKYLTKRGINNKFSEIISKWQKKNDKKILRFLLTKRSYSRFSVYTDNSHQETGGSTYNNSQETGGNTFNNSQKTKGDTNNSFQHTEGATDNGYQVTRKDTRNDFQKTGGDTNNSGQETEGYTNNSCQKTGGDTYNSCQETGGDTSNGSQKTGGDTYNNCQETGGDTDNSCQKAGKEWYCGLIKLKRYPKTTKLIKEAKDDWSLTIQELMLWCAKNSDKVISEISDEV